MEALFPFNSIDNDAEFLTTVTNNYPSMISDVFENGPVFYPFDQSHQFDEFISDFDPDQQYFNNFFRTYGSSYFNELDFNEAHTDNSFMIAHHNIRSAMANLGDLFSYFSLLKSPFSVIGLTETWINQTNLSAIHHNNYNHVYRYRLDRRGGGVSLFIKKSISYIE